MNGEPLYGLVVWGIVLAGLAGLYAVEAVCWIWRRMR